MGMKLLVYKKATHIKSGQNINGLLELGIYEKIKFEITELEKLENVEELVKKHKPTFLIHLASQSSIEKSIKYKDLTYKSNTLISKNIDSVEKYSKDTTVFFLLLQQYLKVTIILLQMKKLKPSLYQIIQFQNTIHKNI